jgi:pilus assembly protein Flp/PilA
MQTSLIKQFWQDEEGATAIEYGLIAGLISVVIVVAITALGGNLSTLFTTISGKLTTANTAASGT